MYIPPKVIERFWSRVDRNGPKHEGFGPCWIYRAPRAELNAVRWFNVGDNAFRVNRFVYMIEVGDIPATGVVLQKCGELNCVRPDHLEALTRYEYTRVNGRLGFGAKHQLAKTHCPIGHEYSPENTYINSKGHRNCRACARDSSKRRRAAMKIGR